MNFIYDMLGIPFGFVLKLIFDTVGNYGAALILFTLFARLLMLPTSLTQQKGTAKTQRLQPKIRKIQEKYKGDNRRIQEETQALYQREGHNPLNAGCLPMLIQMPIIFGLVAVIYKPLTYALEINDNDIAALTGIIAEIFPKLAKSRTIELTVIENIGMIKALIAKAGSILSTDVNGANAIINDIFNLTDKAAVKLNAESITKISGWLKEISPASIQNITSFNFRFLGMELGKVPDKGKFDALWAIPILSGVTSLMSGAFTWLKQRQTNPEMAKNPTMGCMTFGMPLFSVYFTFLFPVGIGIYWIASNIFAFIQTVVISFTHSPQKMTAKLMIEETIQRRSREENLKRVASMKDK